MSEQGRESPPPDQTSGRQLKDPPASGQGTDDASKKDQTNKDALKNLTSNPPGPMDGALKDKFSKTSGGS